VSPHKVLDGARRFCAYTERAGVCRIPLLYFLTQDEWAHVWHPDDAWVEDAYDDVGELYQERARLDFRRRNPELYAESVA
jgi:hypothetical protein